MKNKAIIEKMTLKEKANLTSGKDFWQTQNYDHHEIPSIFLADGPHGIRKQEAAADHLGLNQSLKATCFPTAVTMASSWNLELGKQLGECLSLEAIYQRVNVLLGPGLNIKRNPRCGRNFEYFSEDPYLAGKMASRYVQGIQTYGISGCLKHFACNNQELRRMSIDSVVDERTLREIYLTNFEIAVKEGHPKCIMTSYNPVNGSYASENEHICNDILHDEWKYNGVIVSDWGGMNDRVLGIKANGELEMPTSAGDGAKDIIKAVENGELDEKQLDACVDRLITLIHDTTKAVKENSQEVDFEKHHLVAQQCAEESIVLLENNGVLPLSSDKKVAFVGKFFEEPRYQGAGSSVVNPYKLDKIKDILPEYNIQSVGYEKGFDFNKKTNKGLIKKACKLASQADVVVAFIGLDNITEAEGIDRANIKIPQNQLDLMDELLKLNKEIIVCLFAGSVTELPFAKKVSAMLHCHLYGQAGARALLNTIVGKNNPSGHLAETFLVKYEDTPSANYFHKYPNIAEYKEGLYVGYRYYDKVEKEVLYPFGYGLSYTTFAYSDLVVNEKGVSLKVTNTGSCEGKEVVQLYIGLNDSKIYRPKKELKGFAKINLLPGETKEVEIPFDEYSFRYYNVKTNSWEIEKGIYSLYVGNSIQNILLQGSIYKEGTTDVLPYDLEKIQKYVTGEVTDISDEEFEVLLGRKIPDGNIKFYKKNRAVVDVQTTVEHLRYAPGWTGRLFSGVIRFAIGLLRTFNNQTMANTLIMGVYHQPMRGLSKMTGGAIRWEELKGLIIMFNGKFFKGLGTYFKALKLRKKDKKEAK